MRIHKLQKTLILVFTAFIALSICNTASCEDEDLSTKILGTWIVDKTMEVKKKKIRIYTETTFTKDRRMSVDSTIFVNDQNITYQFGGNWEIDGNIVISKVTKSTNQNVMPLNTVIEDKILKITNETMRYSELNTQWTANKKK
jgi:hypothetical protein